jgi:chorismate-pyruvate lyase
MGEREHIKGKWNKCQELLLTYDNLVKYLLLVDEEVTETLARIEDRSAVETLMQMYSKELESEREATRKAGEQLMHEYVRVVCQEEIVIRVAPH